MSETSSLARIAVHVDLNAASADRVALAADLAAKFGAELAGLASTQPIIPAYAPFGEGFITLQPAIVEAAQKQVDAQLAQAEKTFRAAGGQASSTAWLSSGNLPAADFLARQGRSADLLVVGHEATHDAADPLGLRIGDLMMIAGRPLLAAPAGAKSLSLKTVVVAWKDAREARRALADALPLLKAAGEVIVAGVKPDTSLETLQDVVAYLGRHGANATALLEEDASGGPAQTVLNVARRVNADLIVCGAYGQSRTREWVLGGFTRDMIRHADRACLFSH